MLASMVSDSGGVVAGDVDGVVVGGGGSGGGVRGSGGDGCGGGDDNGGDSVASGVVDIHAAICGAGVEVW